MEEYVVAAVIAAEDTSFNFDTVTIWKQNDKWYGQIDNSEPVEWPSEINGNQFDHTSVNAVQLAKRLVKLYPGTRVYSNELTNKGTKIRLA